MVYHVVWAWVLKTYPARLASQVSQWFDIGKRRWEECAWTTICYRAKHLRLKNARRRGKWSEVPGKRPGARGIWPESAHRPEHAVYGRKALGKRPGTYSRKAGKTLGHAVYGRKVLGNVWTTRKTVWKTWKGGHPTVGKEAAACFFPTRPQNRAPPTILGHGRGRFPTHRSPCYFRGKFQLGTTFTSWLRIYHCSHRCCVTWNHFPTCSQNIRIERGPFAYNLT